MVCVKIFITLFATVLHCAPGLHSSRPKLPLYQTRQPRQDAARARGEDPPGTQLN